MSDEIWFRTGEATVFASDGQGTLSAVLKAQQGMRLPP
jgi:hypothetical protein